MTTASGVGLGASATTGAAALATSAATVATATNVSGTHLSGGFRRGDFLLLHRGSGRYGDGGFLVQDFPAVDDAIDLFTALATATATTTTPRVAALVVLRSALAAPSTTGAVLFSTTGAAVGAGCSLRSGRGSPRCRRGCCSRPSLPSRGFCASSRGCPCAGRCSRLGRASRPSRPSPSPSSRRALRPPRRPSRWPSRLPLLRLALGFGAAARPACR